MRNLSSLGSKNLAHRRGRTILTGLGVALGVALLFGVLVANNSVNRAFDRVAEFRQLPALNVSISMQDGTPLSNDVELSVGGQPEVTNVNLQPDGSSMNIHTDAADIDAWINDTLRPLLPAGARVDRINSVQLTEDNGFADFRASIEGSLAAFSAVALFVGGFLIYLTFSTAVLERTALYGLLRALGARPRQIRRAVIAESLTLGVVSSAVGLVLGLGVAAVVTRLLADAIQISPPPVEIHPAQVAVAGAMGVLTAVVSSLLPARRAAAAEPVTAMRVDHRGTARISRWWIAGLVCLPAGVITSVMFRSLTTAPLSATLLVVGSVLLVPPLLKPVARALGALTRRFGRAGQIPVMHLVKERSRSAYTLALVMVVLAMAYSLEAASQSMHQSLDEVFDKQYKTDLVATVFGSGVTPDQLATVAATPGVKSVTAMGFGRTSYAGRATNVVVIDPATYFGMLSFAWQDGDDASAAAALTHGGAVLLPSDLAARAHVHRGDRIELPSLFSFSSGQFVVAGTFARFGFLEDMGIITGVTDGKVFGVQAPVALRVNVTPGSEAAVTASLHSLSSEFPVRVQTVAALKSVVLNDVDRYFRLFFAVVLVALIVGLLGLANTLGMSIFERTREVGVLRATGMQRRQVGVMVLIESLTLAGVAFVLSIPLGMMEAALLTSSTREQLGFGGSANQPVAWLVPVALLAAAVAAVAALLPARRAARVEIVDALRFE